MLRWCLIAVVMVAVAEAQTDASAFCFGCRSRRNNKDLYADPADCHNYYQCQYINETYAIGQLRKCPAGQFWHDAVMSCMPEGAVACQDRCLSDATAANKCYAGSGCRQFFVCSNTGSFGMCCPVGTSFNAATCACDESATCNDACVQDAPAVPTSVAPASQFNATVCRDSFGRYISVAAEANAYIQIDNDGQATEKLFCPAGVNFDLATCRCDIETETATVPTIRRNRLAILFLPFNPQVADYSTSKFSVFLYDGAAQDSSNAAYGSSSLAVNGGSLEIPGMKSYDLRNQATWAGFFRCNGACQTGAIISNNKDSSSSEFTIIASVQGANTFSARVNLWQPVGAVTVQATFTSPSNGWNFFAVTYDGNAVRLYLNGALADTQFAAGNLAVANCPYVVGNDQSAGAFNGNIDSVYVAPVAYAISDLELIRSGNAQAVINAGITIAWPF